MHYLYLITRDDGEQYVGVTQYPFRRMKEHFAGNGSKSLKGRPFIHDILREGEEVDIYEAERAYIAEHKPSLNIAPGGAEIAAPRGVNHHAATFSDEDIVSIRNRVYEGASRTSIAKEYGVCANTISRICTGTRWSHVGGPITVAKPRLTNEQKEQIKALKYEGHSYKYIAYHLDLKYDKVWRYGRTL